MSLGYKVDKGATIISQAEGRFRDGRSKVDMKGRDHLRGKDVEPFRRKIFERSGGACELKLAPGCWQNAPWEIGEIDHDPDGYERYDSLDSVKWTCPPCHRFRHNREVHLGSIPNRDVPR